MIQRGDVEVIFVNNGSRDRTAAILPKLIAPHAFAKLVQVDVNQGYGFGILSGLRAAQGDILGWTHADMQTDPGDAIRGLELFLSGPAPERIFVKGKRYGRPRTILFLPGGWHFLKVRCLARGYGTLMRSRPCFIAAFTRVG